LASWLSTTDGSLTATTLLAAVAALVTSAELLVLLLRADVRGGSRPDGRALLAACLAVAAAAAGIALCASAHGRFYPVLLLAVGSVWFGKAARFGREGSDDILLIVLVALAVATFPGDSATVVRIWLGFIACQLILAYFISAAAKLAGEKWRRGTAVAQILSTREYGLGIQSWYSSRAPLFVGAAWATIAFEFAAPVMLVLGGPFLWPAVVIGISFHLGVAVTMGLNKFVPSFIAAYPAVIWASLHYGLLS
jgi:hypothetical protein